MTQANIDTPSLITPSPFSEFLAGARDSFPLIVGAIPFGIIFGTLALSSGLSFTGAMAMSALVFAGSAQFIALGLVAAGTAWPIIVLTTFVVNLRHILYSATLAPHVRHLPKQWQAPLAFWLTDETFLVVVKRYTQQPLSRHNQWYYLGSALFMYINWQVCTFLGLTVGQMLPNAAAWGLDFAMPVTFIGMVIPYLKNRPMVAAVVAAGVVALVAQPVPHKLGLMIATLVGIATGMIVEQWGKPEVLP
ncbi:MAG: AzlC family ABC transporter permease [Anaerolineales bacterium]|nr:AzlC family ABC transporter permease [Anaerolineales bacterium]